MGKKMLELLKTYVIFRNPSFVLFLGICPLLAVSDTVLKGLCMGVVTLVVLVLSGTAVSILRRIVPDGIRLAVYAVVIAAFSGVADILLEAVLPNLHASLGLFVPLVAANSIIMARANEFASEKGVADAALDGLLTGLGFTAALLVVSVIREILGHGTLLGFEIFGGHFPASAVMAMPAGAFLTLGAAVAVFNKLTALKKKKEGGTDVDC